MSPAVSITAMICSTVIIVAMIGSSNQVKQNNKRGDNNINGSKDRD